MKVNAHKLLSARCMILCGLVFGLFSCSTTRHVEKERSNEVYLALGLNKGPKDNFDLYREAFSWLHVPHVDGGKSRNGTDCSYLVYSIYKTIYNKTLERNSADILHKNCKQISKCRLKEGDLVFFNTAGKSNARINHVGIYLKDNRFLHASTSRGVMVSNLEEEYYKKTWICGGRVNRD